MSRAARLLGALGAHLGALAALLGAACGGDGGGTAPSVAAPALPDMTVSFARNAVTVGEGGTADIEVRYRINSLASPVSLMVSPLGQGAAPEDYELSATSFEIPAGAEGSGTAALAFTALPDGRISEGEEVVALRLVPPGGVRAQLGSDLAVTIADGPGAPCPGVEVLASPVVPLDSAPQWLTTTLALHREPGAGRIQFDWEGPYIHDEHCDDDACREWWETRSPSFELNVVEWRVESSSSGTDHSMDIEWFESKTARLRFQSADGACEGAPTVVCNDSGCELRR